MSEKEIIKWVGLLEHLNLTHHPIETLLYAGLSVKKRIQQPVWDYLATT
jgi:hypothetical protein